MFLPGAPQTFMMEHPVEGWSGFALMLVLYRPVSYWYRKQAERTQQRNWGKRVAALSTHWSKEEARLADAFREKEAELFRINSEKDVFLLNERLTDMEMNSKFHTYLAEGVDHKNLDFAFVTMIEDRLSKWDRDWREFFDPGVADAWDKFTAAARAYAYKVSEYMWTKEDSERLHVPPEWKDNDHKRYQKAFKELDSARTALYVAVNEIHRIQHARGVPGSPKGSKAFTSPRGMSRNNLVDPPPVPQFEQ